jgi:hypothetical protein
MGNLQLLMQPVGVAVSIVCVRAMVSFSTVNIDFNIQGNKKLFMDVVVEH